MKQAREGENLPQDLGHHFACTSPRALLCPIQQPCLQPSLSTHDQQLPLLCSLVRTHSQSTKTRDNKRKEHNLRLSPEKVIHWYECK